MNYLLVKHLHVTCVLISISLFAVRGTLQLQAKPWQQWRLLRLARISQVIEDAGQIGGPWFVRCDGQQLPVSEANARLILGLLGLSMEG